VRVIQIKDIDDDNILRTDGLSTVQVDSPQRYAVNQGDVLFLSRGRQLTATEITQPLTDIIATSYYFILTPKPDFLLSGYLAWSLNQRKFQHRLAVVTNTTSIPWVSRADLEELQIEVPPIETQQKIVHLLALHNKQRSLTIDLIDKREQLVTAVCNQLADGALDKEV
jgi:restriction endonuclease S subunit